MLDGLRLYGRYIGISFRSQMQYRALFHHAVRGPTALMTGLEFLGIWALFDRFTAPRHLESARSGLLLRA